MKKCCNKIQYFRTLKIIGLIGWINQNNLSKKIENELVNLNKGQITKAIKVPGGMLILKLR